MAKRCENSCLGNTWRNLTLQKWPSFRCTDRRKVFCQTHCQRIKFWRYNTHKNGVMIISINNCKRHRLHVYKATHIIFYGWQGWVTPKYPEIWSSGHSLPGKSLLFTLGHPWHVFFSKFELKWSPLPSRLYIKASWNPIFWPVNHRCVSAKKVEKSSVHSLQFNPGQVSTHLHKVA